MIFCNARYTPPPASMLFTPPVIGVFVLLAVIVIVAVVMNNRSPPPSATACGGDSDCTAPQKCQAGYCAAPVCSPPCSGGLTCQADGTCAVPPPPPGSCTDDTQCTFPQVCLSGSCGQRPKLQPTCSPPCVPPLTCQAGGTCALPCTPVACTDQYICQNNTCVSPNAPLSRCTDQQEAQFYRVKNAGSELNPGACTITSDGKRLHFVNAYAEQNGQILIPGLGAADCQARCDTLGESGCVGWATNNGANGVNNCKIFPSDIPRYLQGDANWSVDVSARVVNTPHQ